MTSICRRPARAAMRNNPDGRGRGFEYNSRPQGSVYDMGRMSTGAAAVEFPARCRERYEHHAGGHTQGHQRSVQRQRSESRGCAERDGRDAARTRDGLIIANNTQVRYAPAANWYGADSFTYTISDGREERIPHGFGTVTG